MVEHPAARALTGYLLVRGGVHQVAYARALERLTGADLMKLFPTRGFRPRRSPSASRTSSAATTFGSTASRPTTTWSFLPSSTARTRKPAKTWSSSTRRRRECLRATFPPSPRSSRRTTRPRRSPRSRGSFASKPDSPRSRPARSRTGRARPSPRAPPPGSRRPFEEVETSKGGGGRHVTSSHLFTDRRSSLCVDLLGERGRPLARRPTAPGRWGSP